MYKNKILEGVVVVALVLVAAIIVLLYPVMVSKGIIIRMADDFDDEFCLLKLGVGLVFFPITILTVKIPYSRNLLV